MKAVTRRLDSDVDLLAAGELLFERNRLGLAGRGVALRVPLREAAETLAAITVDDEVGGPGCGVVAFGALPFVPGAPAELIVPSEVFGRADDGTRWHTTIGTGAHPQDGTVTSVRTSPSRYSIEPSRTPESWCELVEA